MIGHDLVLQRQLVPQALAYEEDDDPHQRHRHENDEQLPARQRAPLSDGGG